MPRSAFFGIKQAISGWEAKGLSFAIDSREEEKHIAITGIKLALFSGGVTVKHNIRLFWKKYRRGDFQNFEILRIHEKFCLVFLSLN